MTDFPIRFRALWPPLAGGLIFLGERVMGSSPEGVWFSGAGAVLLLVLLVAEILGWRLKEAGKITLPVGLGALPGGFGALPLGLFILAALFYFLGGFIPSLPSDGIKWHDLLAWGWVLCLLTGVPLYFFLELAWRVQLNNPRADIRRLRRAASAGVFLGLLASLIVTLNFIFNLLGWEADLAYFKTSEPSQTTLETVEGLEITEGEVVVQAALFFSTDSPIIPLVLPYFETLAKSGEGIEISVYDADLHPEAAKNFRVRNNGTVVLKKGKTRKNIILGKTLEKARKNLKKLDGSVLKALMEVTRSQKTAYFTVGHGERSEKKMGVVTPYMKSNKLDNVLAERNFKIKTLSPTEGLGREIPGDADLLIIMGPETPFLSAEIDSIEEYLDQGGSLLVFLEPDIKSGGTEKEGSKNKRLMALLARYGMKYSPLLQANDRIFARRTRTKADHALLVTVSYQNHPTVRTLRNRPKENALLLLGAGAWKIGKTEKQVRVSEIVRGMKGTWGDSNGNFTFDQGRETRSQPILGLAVAPRKKPAPGEKKAAPRIIGFSDADLALDFLMENRTNRRLISETVRWLAGEDQPPGMPTTEEDLKIIHAKSDELVWFYLPVFGVPLFVAGLGFFLTTRGGKSRRRK